MPVFVALVILGAILIWFLLAKCFESIGNVTGKLAKPFTALKDDPKETNINGEDDKNEK